VYRVIAAIQVTKHQNVLHHWRVAPQYYNNQSWRKRGGRLLIVSMVTVRYIQISDREGYVGPT